MTGRCSTLSAEHGEVQPLIDVLEALYIKKLKPELCKQMEFVKCTSLDLFPTLCLVKIIHAHSCTITTTSHIYFTFARTCILVVPVSPTCTPAV